MPTTSDPVVHVLLVARDEAHANLAASQFKIPVIGKDANAAVDFSGGGDMMAVTWADADGIVASKETASKFHVWCPFRPR